MSQTAETNLVVQTPEGASRHSGDLLRMMAGSVMQAMSYPASEEMIKGILKTKIHTTEDLLFESLNDNEARKGKILRFATIPISGGLPDSAKTAIAEIDSNIPVDERLSMREHAITVFRDHFSSEFHDLYDRLCIEVVTNDRDTAMTEIQTVVTEDTETVTTEEIALLLHSAHSLAA